MYSFSKEKKNLFLQYIADVLVEDFDYTTDMAKQMTDSSALVDLLDKMPDFVLHYSVHYWAMRIVEENASVCV